MQRIDKTWILLAAVLFGLASEPAAAQETATTPDALTGVWTPTGDVQEKQRRLKAIEAATAEMSFFIRGTARKRLGKGTTPPARLQLTVEGERFTIARDGMTFSLQLGAAPISVEKGGKKAKVSAKREGNAIVMESQGEKGQSVTTYALSADGQRLTMSVRMTGERLSGVLAFQATFRRQAAAEKGGPSR